jgi:hypothetical protein
MFTQNSRTPDKYRGEDTELRYFKLYYQFIKHAFGLAYREPAAGSARIRLYFDQFPDTRERSEQFKGFLSGLNKHARFKAAGIQIAREDIAEVRSHDHVLLQCLDIVLGAMAFRLNYLHKAIPPGKNRRGRRTVAKERLYNAILAEIRAIKPNFNIGISTGRDGDRRNYWRSPYMHWCFASREAVFGADDATEDDPK